MNISKHDIEHFISQLNQQGISADYELLRIEIKKLLKSENVIENSLLQLIIHDSLDKSTLLSKDEVDIYNSALSSQSLSTNSQVPILQDYDSYLDSLIQIRNDQINTIEEENQFLQLHCHALEDRISEYEKKRDSDKRISDKQIAKTHDEVYKISLQVVNLTNNLKNTINNALNIIDELSLESESDYAFKQKKLYKKMFLRDSEFIQTIDKFYQKLKNEIEYFTQDINVNEEMTRLIEGYSTALYEDLSASTSLIFNETLLQSFKEEKLRPRISIEEKKEVIVDKLQTQLAELLQDPKLENTLDEYTKMVISDPIMKILNEKEIKNRNQVLNMMKMIRKELNDQIVRLQIHLLVYENEMNEIKKFKWTLETFLEDIEKVIKDVQNRILDMKNSKVNMRIKKDDISANTILSLIDLEKKQMGLYVDTYEDLLKRLKNLKEMEENEKKEWKNQLSQLINHLDKWVIKVDNIEDILYKYSKGKKLEWKSRECFLNTNDFVKDIKLFQPILKEAQKYQNMNEKMKKKQIVFEQFFNQEIKEE